MTGQVEEEKKPVLCVCIMGWSHWLQEVASTASSACMVSAGVKK